MRRIGRALVLGWLGVCVAALAGCAVHPMGTCGPSCNEIDDASKIALSSERLDVLNAVAARRFLSQHEQFYLVNATIHGGVGGDQGDPLITLIRNPVCSQETRDYISERLRFITFSRERRRVADALAETDRANPPAGPIEPGRPLDVPEKMSDSE